MVTMQDVAREIIRNVDGSSGPDAGLVERLRALRDSRFIDDPHRLRISPDERADLSSAAAALEAAAAKFDNLERCFEACIASGKEQHARATRAEAQVADRDKREADLLLRLIDTLKPLAGVAERFRDCSVVEISKPNVDNPSSDILPMPREWFERADDDMEAIVIQLHAKGVLSEGQVSTMTGLDRVEVRKLADSYATPTPEPAADAS